MAPIEHSAGQEREKSGVSELEEKHQASLVTPRCSLNSAIDNYSLEYFDSSTCQHPEGKWSIEFQRYHQRSPAFVYHDEPTTTPTKEVTVDQLFLTAYQRYLDGEYYETKELVERLLKRAPGERPLYFGCKLHLLSLGTAALFRLGSFYTAVWMARAGRTLSGSAGLSAGVSYFEEMLGVIETTAGLPNTWNRGGHSLISSVVSAQLGTRLCLENKILRSATYAEEPSLLRDVKIYDVRERSSSKTVAEYIAGIKNIGEVCARVSPLMVYLIGSEIAFGLIFAQNGKSRMSVIKTNINGHELLARLQRINTTNKEILRRTCNDEAAKKQWWADRIALDRAIQQELVALDGYLNKFAIKGKLVATTVALIIEDILGVIPLEMCSTFTTRGVYRCSSLHQLLASPGRTTTNNPAPAAADDSEFFYLLNPEQNLPSTETKIRDFLNREMPQARGITGRPPGPLEIEQQILDHRVFLYFGHGGGEKFFSPQGLDKLTKRVSPQAANSALAGSRLKTICLFGCASAKIMAVPNYNPHSTCISYLHHPLVGQVLGALWDVTDKDLDMVTLGVLYSLKKNTPALSVALNTLRHQCKLKYLNGAALVLYGADQP